MPSDRCDQREVSGDPYLIFRARKQEFGLPAARVSEIRTVPRALAEDLTKASGLCCGSISLHGQAIPVVDLGGVLGLGPLRLRNRHCLIVLELDCGESEPQKVGMLVDAVSKVVPISNQRISENSNGGPTLRASVGRVRINGRVKQLLDPDRLVSIEELDSKQHRSSVPQSTEISLQHG